MLLDLGMPLYSLSHIIDGNRSKMLVVDNVIVYADVLLYMHGSNGKYG